MDRKEITYSSILSPFIEGLINEKRAVGYKYETEAVTLKRFDQYCIDHHLDTLHVSRDFLQEWCTKLNTEKICSLSKRVTTIRQLLLYMTINGVEVYIPSLSFRKEIVVPHLFTSDEIIELFQIIDSWIPSTCNRPYHRIANEYRVLFRILCCCGLRNSEASTIRTKNVNLTSGILTIANAKRNRDRLVYMSDDLTVLCREYFAYITQELGYVPEFFFPGIRPEKPIPNTSVDSAFNRFWNLTSFSKICNNKPTVHDFRFSFITNRINLWAREDVDVENRLPYLSMYCGHSSIQETYYYFHTNKELYESIRKKDRTSEMVIPEVRK